jgi:beta-keto acid cleavage enzyme
LDGTRKVIITCAVTGAIHTPTMSPHLPVTPKQIADAAIGAANERPASAGSRAIQRISSYDPEILRRRHLHRADVERRKLRLQNSAAVTSGPSSAPGGIR